MFRIIFFLLIFTFGVTFVTGSSIGSQIGLVIFGAMILYVVTKVGVDIWLHFRKREEDQEAFESVLGEPAVESYTDIDAYARRRRIKSVRRERQ